MQVPTKVLAKERSQRHILPSLNIPSRPIVQNNQPKNVIPGRLDIHRHPQFVGRSADKVSHLEFVVEFLALGGFDAVRCFDLAAGPDDGGSGGDDGGGAAVVGDGDVEPFESGW